MFIEDLAAWLNGIVLLLSLMAIVYALYIVWKVERMLDVSFKLFLVSIIAFAVSEVAAYFAVEPNNMAQMIESVAKFFFALLFVLGMISMKNMIKRVEKEMKK